MIYTEEAAGGIHGAVFSKLSAQMREQRAVLASQIRRLVRSSTTPYRMHINHSLESGAFWAVPRLRLFRAWSERGSRLIADCKQGLLSADVEFAVGNCWRSEHALTEGMLINFVELASWPHNVRDSILGDKVYVSAGEHRRRAKFSAQSHVPKSFSRLRVITIRRASIVSYQQEVTGQNW